MKKKIIIVLITLLTFSLTFIGCGDTNDAIDVALNGTWVHLDGLQVYLYKTEINYTNGDYTLSDGNTQYVKGTYNTTGNKITMEASQINLGYFNESDKALWYTRDASLALSSIELDPLNLKEGDIIEMFKPVTTTYFIDGKYLYIYSYNANGDYLGEEMFTRRE